MAEEHTFPFAPVTRGLEFIEDHHRFWLTGDNEFVTPEARDALRRIVDQMIILDDLPEHAEVDPEFLRPYPPIRSEVPLPGLGEVLEQIRSAYGQTE
jgi:hypothetical protein